jgi:LacI family transcriptional regulator
MSRSSKEPAVGAGGSEIPGRPTITDVARLAGVSFTTAGRVLARRGYSSAEARQRVLSAAEQLGYVPNFVARSLRHGRTTTIGLLVADVENSFYSSLAKNVEAVATRAGYFVVLCNSADDPERERELLQVLAALRIAGLILTPTGANRQQLQRFKDDGIAVVQVDRTVERLEADTVIVDNENGAYEAVTALVAVGHRRIGLLAGAERTTTGRDRTRGYCRALEEHGLPVDPALIRGGSFKRERAIEEARALLAIDPPVTAIFAENNILAETCVLAIREAGLTVPGDVSLVAFDDVEWMRMLDNGITTIRQPVADLGRSAAEMLLRRIKGGSSAAATIVYQPTLILRGSVAPVQAPQAAGDGLARQAVEH